MATPVPQSYPLLASLDLPADLDGLDERALADLSDEIRSFMLEVISQNGGHLSPNLGVVELMLAREAITLRLSPFFTV